MLLSTLPLLLLSTLALATPQSLSQVYLYPNPANTKSHTPLTLSADQARSVIAHHLGTSKEVHLPDVFGEVEGWGRLLVGGLFGSKEDDSLSTGRVLIVQGVQNALDITSNKPSFELKENPSTVRSLLQPYLDKASDLVKQAGEGIESVHVPGFLLDAFGLKQDEATQTLHRELQTLSNWVSNVLPSSYSSGAFDSMSVGGLENVDVDSEEYHLGVSVVKGAVDSMTSTSQRPFILIITPPSSSATISPRALAAAPSNSSLPTNGSNAPAPNLPIFSTSLCYTDAETCEANTTSCHGRGSCVAVTRAGKTCYGCACEKSADGSYWGGVGCEKKNVSSSFTLLFFSSIFLVVLILGSVAMLSTVGLDPLPSVLTGGSGVSSKRMD